MAIKRQLRAWSFLLLFLGGHVGPLLGQLPPVTESLRGKRVLGVGNVAFFDAWKPNVSVGFLGQISLARMTPTLEDGVQTYAAPLWYAHALGTGGIRTEGGTSFSAYGELGLVRRMNSPGILTSAGVAGFYNLEPEGYGAVIRSDILMDNAYVQAGFIRFRGVDGTGFYFGLGIMRCLLKDLEFTESCIGG